MSTAAVLSDDHDGALMEHVKFEDRWPELFDPLTTDQRRNVLHALASSWHEGWVPSREDVADLTELATGAIDRAEYRRRSRVKAQRAAGTD